MAKEKKEKEEKSSVAGALLGLDKFTEQFNTQFGAGAGMVLGALGTTRNVRWVDIDGMALAEAFGQGFPRGRMLEVFGPESSGKTSLCTFVGVQCQRFFFEDKNRMGRVAYLDMEHAFDPVFAQTVFGLDPGHVFFSQPDSGEQCLNMAEYLMASGQFDLVVVDSVATLIPQAELDGEIGDAHMGLQARMMGQAMRKINPLMTPLGPSIIFVNQERAGMKAPMPGMPPLMVTTGGNSLKFFASIRIKVQRGDYIEMKSGNVVGIESKLNFVKNKVAPPFKKVVLKLFFDRGYDFEDEYFDYFKKFNLIQGSGYYTIPGGALVGHPVEIEEEIPKKLGGGVKMVPMKIQGYDKVMAFFAEHPDLYQALKVKVRELFKKRSEVIIAQHQAVADTFVDSDAEVPDVMDEPEEDPFSGVPVPTPEAPVAMVPRRRGEAPHPPVEPEPAPEPTHDPVEKTEPEPAVQERDPMPVVGVAPPAPVEPEPVQASPEAEPTPEVIAGIPVEEIVYDADGVPQAPAHLVRKSSEWCDWNVAHGLTPTGRKKMTYSKTAEQEAGLPSVAESLPGE